MERLPIRSGAQHWKEGTNEVLLTYSTTPYRENPGYRGPNAVIAVQYLELD